MSRRRLTGLAVWVLVAAAAIPSPVGAQVPKRAERGALVAAAREIMKAAGVCAVITVDASGLPQARAIDIFQPDDEMVVWFATNPKSRKVGQIARDPRITVYCAEPKTGEFVSLMGRARLVNDPAEKQKRWKPGFAAFWPDRGDSYLLVEITPERLEVVSPSRGVGTDAATWAPQSVVFERRKTP